MQKCACAFYLVHGLEMKGQWLIPVTQVLTFICSSFSPHSVFMCFVWISEQTAIISLADRCGFNCDPGKYNHTALTYASQNCFGLSDVSFSEEKTEVLWGLHSELPLGAAQNFIIFCRCESFDIYNYIFAWTVYS
jgi:hypothetical protein